MLWLCRSTNAQTKHCKKILTFNQQLYKPIQSNICFANAFVYMLRYAWRRLWLSKGTNPNQTKPNTLLKYQPSTNNFYNWKQPIWILMPIWYNTLHKDLFNIAKQKIFFIETIECRHNQCHATSLWCMFSPSGRHIGRAQRETKIIKCFFFSR
jgi:hypothetical protein